MSEPRPVEERRAALKRIVAAGAIVAGSGGAALWLRGRDPDAEREALPKLPRYAVEPVAGKPKLAIAHGKDADAMLRTALEPMGGIGRFVVKNDVVVLKPNIGFDRPPVLGATTSPEVVGAVTRLCVEAGAKRVIVTDNPINDPEGSFIKSRIRRAVEAAGGEVMLPAPRHFRDVAIGGEVLRAWDFFHAPFREATKVIGIPTAKDHNLSGASLGMKNWYGLLGRGRNRFHQSIHEVIADLGQLMAPTLMVLDGTRLLMRNGPTGGSIADVKAGETIAVATDPVALDAYGFHLLEKSIDGARYLALAEERGLGTRDWKSLRPPELGTERPEATER